MLVKLLQKIYRDKMIQNYSLFATLSYLTAPGAIMYHFQENISKQDGVLGSSLKSEIHFRYK